METGLEPSVPQLPTCHSGPSLLFSDTSALSQNARTRGPPNGSEEPKSKLVIWYWAESFPVAWFTAPHREWLSANVAGIGCGQ